MFDFEKFPVYQKAEQFYALVLKILQSKEIDKSTKDQLRRAALSIVLNIAEGAGKYSVMDKKNFYITSRGSVNECVAVFRILKMEKKISENIFKEGYELLLEIAKMLTGLVNSLVSKKNYFISKNLSGNLIFQLAL
jgi:four helix bundle protein